MASAQFYPILKGEYFCKHVQVTFILPRRNIIMKGFGNNGIFGKEMLLFNMITIKIH